MNLRQHAGFRGLREVLLRQEEGVGVSGSGFEGGFQRDGFEGEGDGGDGEIVDVLVEIGIRAVGVSVVGTACFPGLLPLHGWNEHAVIVYQHRGAVGTHEDIVGFEVTVGEGLGEEPRRHAVETVTQHRQFIWIVKIPVYIGIEGLTLYPFHHDDGEFLVAALVGIDEQLILKVAQREDIGRGYDLKFVGNLLIAFVASRLVLYETLDGVEFAVAHIPHLEDNGEVAARHDGLAP